VLRQLRRRSLAKLRREVEPVDHAVLGRLVTTWQGLTRRRQGSDALLDATSGCATPCLDSRNGNPPGPLERL
jgi:hypothetical protein